MATTIDHVMEEISMLSSEERLRLINRILESVLDSSTKKPHRPLKYGEFSGPNPSTEEDFKLAEWHIEDQILDGE